MQNYQLSSVQYRADTFGQHQKAVSHTVLILLFVALQFVSMPATFGQSAEEETTPPKTQLLFGTITIDGSDQVEIDYSLFSVAKVAESDAVKVPYTVTKVVNGAQVVETRYREEIRTRLVEKVSVRLIRRNESLDRIKLFRVSGKALTAGDINAIRERKTAAILLSNDQSIEPYYQSIMQPESIVVRLPAVQRTR